jgi:hypothetical protein
MAIRFAQSKKEDSGGHGTERMVAVGEIPARDMEFEALLRNAAELQKLDFGCKLRGETM